MGVSIEVVMDYVLYCITSLDKLCGRSSQFNLNNKASNVDSSNEIFLCYSDLNFGLEQIRRHNAIKSSLSLQ